MRTKIQNLADQKWSVDRTLGNTGLDKGSNGGATTGRIATGQNYLGQERLDEIVYTAGQI